MPVLVTAVDPLDFYTVAPGDGLIKIGKVTGYRWQDIAALNGIAAPAYIVRLGQVLRLPVVTHTVQDGDDLETVAAAYGVTWQRLAERNALIRVGQVLKIPSI